MRHWFNPSPRQPCSGLFSTGDYHDVQHFYSSLEPSPLLSLPSFARRLGLAQVLVKDESRRLGLNAFKILGVNWAMERLHRSGGLAGIHTFVCSTDGNHGRAVARAAHTRGLSAVVFVPAHISQSRRQAIEAEGADVRITTGNYDAATAEAAALARSPGHLMVSDTSWPGYEQIPRWIMAGYTQLMAEAARQWDHVPDAIFVPVGVGGLAAAVASWCCQHLTPRPLLIASEPDAAPCLLASLQAGCRVLLQGSLETSMAGLSCGEVSFAAWPLLHHAIDAAISVPDSDALRITREIAPEFFFGDSSAAGPACLAAFLQSRLSTIPPLSRVLLINTEAALIS